MGLIESPRWWARYSVADHRDDFGADSLMILAGGGAAYHVELKHLLHPLLKRYGKLGLVDGFECLDAEACGNPGVVVHGGQVAVTEVGRERHGP
ncbi:hypothetical protein Shyd_68360 [Streptomyces hydrogenans]|uniref:Uncharacterized protein n=1 Tax=Streptomyces hydrogenans TaxID=1873719 RepID=A0ABQ3PKC2_9ACTN|nr:hypothetical protein Shyd_68360 [Streptomyces hydrogenans]